MPDYTDSQVKSRVSSGKDKNRARTADQLYAQATQPPHDDDAAALQKLRGFSMDKGGWATNDAVNYGRSLLRQIPGGTDGLDAGGGYVEARDGGGFLGSIGSVLKKLAPAAMLIPGLGPLAAGGISALANTGGSLMKGEGLDLGGSLKDGLLSAAGAGALGGQGVNGIGGIPGRLGLGGAGNAASAAGNATQSMAGAASAAAPAAAPGGILAKLGGMGNVVKGGAAVAGFLGDRASRKSNERFANAQLDLRNKQLGMAEQDYASRAPLRNAAISRLGQMAQQPIGSSIYGRQG